MKLDHYEIRAGSQSLSFEFISEGPKGQIQKLVQFTLIDLRGYYNLAFGDKDLMTGEIDDTIVTDNGDTDKVLATVVAAVYSFCTLQPMAWIYATGSTPARTRLYRIGINKYFEAAMEHFDVFGETEEKWKRFIKNEKYKAFLVRLKNDKFDL